MSFDPAILTKYADLVGGAIGFTLTLMVLSYIFGDNFLFRLATHIFIGVAAAFATVIVIQNVIIGRLFLPLIEQPGKMALQTIPPLLMGLWLFTKLSPRLARFGNPVVAYLVGVGAAAAIGGAVIGTIFPQVGATTALLDMNTVETSAKSIAAQSGKEISVGWIIFQNVIILIGTMTTLVFFHFGARPQTDQTVRRPAWIEIVSWVGQIFIAVTLGALFAGVLASALAAFIERIHFLWNFILYNVVPVIFPIQ